jgi:hypothetical protein
MTSLMVLLTLAGALPDRGIFPELAARVNLEAPRAFDRAHAWLRVDHPRKLVTLYEGDDPIALYVEGAADVPTGLRVVAGAPPRDEDRDGDGIVDRLDVLIGAKKLLYNGARYIERYVSIAYPGGDVPRTEGVCSDTVIRALRNAGLDLQREVHEDILRAPAAYPMVEKVDASINHRRVRTLLPWFVRRRCRRAPGSCPATSSSSTRFPRARGPIISASSPIPSARPVSHSSSTIGPTAPPTPRWTCCRGCR